MSSAAVITVANCPPFIFITKNLLEEFSSSKSVIVRHYIYNKNNSSMNKNMLYSYWCYMHEAIQTPLPPPVTISSNRFSTVHTSI